jgi:hypothetical protein
MPGLTSYDRGSVVGRIVPSTPGGRWIFEVHYLGGPGRFQSYESFMNERGAEVALQEYLDQITPADDDSRASPVTVALRREIEAFVSLWERVSPDLDMDPDDKRVGDALSRMAAEVSRVDDPPRGVLKGAVVPWFGHKLDTFTEEATKAAGKSFGTAAGVGMAATATGNLPRLIDTLGKVRDLLG